MWSPWEWARRSNARAVVNARTATTECCRRRLERVEVDLFLAARGIVAPGERHPA